MPIPAPPPKPRRRRRWWRRIFIGLAATPFLIVALVGGEWTWTRAAGQRKLDALTTRLDADEPGWGFDDTVTAHDAGVPADDANVSVKLERIFETRSDGPDRGGSGLSDFRELRGGRWPNEVVDPVAWAALEAKFPAWVPVVEGVMRQSASAERGRAKIQLSQDPFKHTYFQDYSLWDADRVGYILAAQSALAWRAMRSADRGDANESLAAAVAGLRLIRSIDFAPTFNSFLKWVDAAQIPIRAVEQTLAWCPDAADADLAALQALLLKEADESTLAPALRGERAFNMKVIDLADRDRTDLWGNKSEEQQWEEFCDRKRMPAYRRQVLEYLGRLKAFYGHPPERRHPALAVRQLPPEAAENEFLRNVGKVTIRVVEREFRHRATCLCAAAGIACERYRLKHGQWPNELDDLAEFGVPKGLVDPFTDRPLRCGPTSDGVVVFTAGPNGNSKKEWYEPNNAFRLWDEASRKVPKTVPPARE